MKSWNFAIMNFVGLKSVIRLGKYDFLLVLLKTLTTHQFLLKTQWNTLMQLISYEFIMKMTCCHNFSKGANKKKIDILVKPDKYKFLFVLLTSLYNEISYAGHWNKKTSEESKTGCTYNCLHIYRAGFHSFFSTSADVLTVEWEVKYSWIWD